jgi:DNA-binding NarL/FixJ family response regulator
MKRILIADDHALIREALAGCLERRFSWAQSDFAASFEQVMQRLNVEPRCALVLLDLRMPGMGGVESVAAVVTAAAPAPVIVCTAVEAPDLLFRLRQAGVYHLVSKAGDNDDLLNAIDSLGLNEAADGMSGGYVGSGNAESADVSGALLTARQLSILRLLHQGKPNKIIASELGVTLSTVKSHLYVTFTRLQVKSRAEALSKTRDWFL